MRLYVGNLNYRSSENELEDLFGQFGQVDEVAIITDRETGRSRGFAFVTMAEEDAANQAIESLNGNDYDGRSLVVNEAKPRENSGGGGRRGGGGGGGGGGYRGGRGGGGDRY